MIYEISSTQNAYIKTLKTLKNKKGRTENALFIAEGDKCAEEAVINGCAKAILTRDPHHPIASLAQKTGTDVYIVTDAILSAVCDSKTPQAVCAVCDHGALPKWDGSGELFAALENVSDPQNIGTIIRTADAAGAGAVILSPECADFTSPKAVRAAMGSVFHIPVVIADDFYGQLRSLKDSGVALIAGHLKGGHILPESGRTCIMIGNEARGLTENASTLADVLYKINIYGRAESLNAAVAAGILLYKIADR